MTVSTRVVIVGGGPVGMALAVNLGLRGIASTVIERRTDIQQIPKGQNLLQRSMEHFWFWGIEQELRAGRVIPRDFPMTGIVAYGNLANEYWYAPPQREVLNPYYLLQNERLPQYAMEKVLRDKIAVMDNVDLRLGWSADSVAQDADGVRIGVTAPDGARETIQGAYAVGCDGSRSRVREAIGITQSGADYDQPMVLTVFCSPDLNGKLNARFPAVSTYRVHRREIGGYWQFFGRVDEDEGWFFHSPVPPGMDRDTVDYLGLMRQVAGFDFDADFTHKAIWDLRVSVADIYQVGRVFIAGDAAHSHPPYGGYGLNNGLEDAVNLGWKLAAVLKGWGGDALLATYGEERHPIFRETGDDFIAARIDSDAEFFDRHNPERDRADFERAWKDHAGTAGPRLLNYEPNYAGSSIVAGPPGAKCSAHGSHSFNARPGHHLPPQPLSSGRNVYEELVQDFTLLAFDADDSTVVGFERAAASLNVPLKTVRDSYGGGREAYEAKLILVRPDQFVAWCGNAGPDDAAAVMGKVVGAS